MGKVNQYQTKHQAQPECECGSGDGGADNATVQQDFLEELFKGTLFGPEPTPSPDTNSPIGGTAQNKGSLYLGEEGTELEDDKMYDPGSKGDATWENGSLETADGWIITTGPVKPHFYLSIKGIDLVRWFVDCHMSEQKHVFEARVEKTQQVENPLEIPNPKPPRKVAGKKHNRHRRKETPFPLLDLPLEIRRLAYSFAIGHSRVLIRGSHPNKEFEAAKAVWRAEGEFISRPRYRLSHLLDNDDIDNRAELSPALLLVSQQVKTEVEPILYSQLTFCFDSIKVVHKFLNSASYSGIQRIKKLELHHVSYGRPALAANRQFRTRNSTNWRQTCRRIAQELPMLSWLKIDIMLNDQPVDLQPTARWWRTLLRLVPNGPLDHVEIALSYRGADRYKVQRAARRLEDRMMSVQGQQARDEKESQLAIQRVYEAEAKERAARLARLKVLPPVQAKSVLNIRLGQTSGSMSNQAVVAKPKKYYTSKNDGFTKEWMYGTPLH